VREELGDVLLQVLFHARVAAEAPEELGGVRFDIDDVAADLVAKLVGRHPHVFAGTERIDTAERQEHRWDELKRAEKQRESSVDGVPLGQPAVALAAKLTTRTARAGLPPDLLTAGNGVGERLFTAAARAKLAGTDPEAALRTAARRFADDVRAAERAARAAGLDPHALDAAAWRAHWPTE
jgi:XTP/dITP diphosphohydrolase